MAIDFPDAPTTGDTYSTNGRTWIWNGSTWTVYGNFIDPTVLKIDSSNNRVGVNNTSPSTTLDVTGNVSATGDVSVSGDISASGNITTGGASVATTGKAIAMAMVFGG